MNIGGGFAVSTSLLALAIVVGVAYAYKRSGRRIGL